MTETLKVNLDGKLIKKFKKKAFETYGYRKGSVKMAVEDLLKDYTSLGRPNWDGLQGVLKSRTETSVELQHTVWKSLSK